MTRIQILLGVMLTTVCLSPASAEQCSYVGQEICINGEVYRCEQTGRSVLTPIRQNRTCTVSAQSLKGTWRGSGHSVVQGTDYPIVMTINGTEGEIDYPTLHCGGTLTRISGDGTSAQYREHITYGDCIDGGNISVNLVRGRMAWTWSGQDSGKQYTVIAVLERR
jgi:hypothetical protein